MKTLSLSQEYYFLSVLAEEDRPLFKGLLKGQEDQSNTPVLQIMPVTLGTMVRCKGSDVIKASQLFLSAATGQEYLVFRASMSSRYSPLAVYTVSKCWHQDECHSLERQ